MRGQKAVLHIEKGREAIFSGTACDQRQIARFLGCAPEQYAPARVGNRHDVVMTGVNIQALTRQRPRADVKHDRQPLT